MEQLNLNIMKGKSWGFGPFTINPGFELLNWGIRFTIDGSWGYWEWITQVGPFWLYVGYISKRRIQETEEFLARIRREGTEQ